MLTTILIVAMSPIPWQGTTARNGLLNHSFERELETGTTGTSGNPVYGAYWINAEERTDTGASGNRFLCLEAGDLAYQRLGSELGKAETGHLTGSVFLTEPDGEGRVTFADTGLAWSLHYVLRNTDRSFYHDGDGDPGEGETLIRWEAWLSTNGGTPIPLEHKNEVFFGSSNADRDDPNTIDELDVHLQLETAGFLDVIYNVPKDGVVRLVNRPYFAEDSVPVSDQVDFSVSYAPPMSSSFSQLAQRSIAASDRNGPMILVRHEVETDGQVRFRWTMPQNTDNTEVLFRGHPVVSYEGNSYTYRFLGPQWTPGPQNPPQGEIFENINIADNQWVPFDLDAGQDHHAAFCQGFCPNDLLPPLDVKLTSISGDVHFDNVRCLVDWDDLSAADTRDAILDEAEWFRRIVLGQEYPQHHGILDHNSFGWQRGDEASFFEAHELRLVSGAKNKSGTSFKLTPDEPVKGLWPLLRARYDSTDYEHFVFSVEHAYREGNRSPVGFAFFKYDVETDLYLQIGDYADVVFFRDPLNTTSDAYKDLMSWYQRTNDPVYLDRVIDASLVFEQHGVLTDTPPMGGWPDRTGYIAFRGFDFLDGTLKFADHAAAFEDMFGLGGELGYKTKNSMTAVGPLIEFYARARLFNEQHSGVSPERFDPIKLAGLASTLRTAVDKCVITRIPQEFPSNGTGEWSFRPFTTWHRTPGLFNDVFGNQGQDALRGYVALKDLKAEVGSLGVDEGYIFDTLEEKWLVEGTEFMYSIWEQGLTRGEFLAADFQRGLPMFVEVINNPDITVTGPANADKDDYRTLIHETGLVGMKSQYFGHWGGVGIGRFQLLDIASRDPGPATNYPLILGHAFEVGPASDNELPTKAGDLRAYLSAYLKSNQDHFKFSFGYVDDMLYEGPQDVEEGITVRTLGAFLATIDMMGDDPYSADPPVAEPSVTPGSYEHQVPDAPKPFRFFLTWDPASPPTAAEQDEAFNDRTAIWLWQMDGNGEWGGERVWPDQATDFSAPAAWMGSPNIRFIRTNDLYNAQDLNATPYKFVLVTWDEDLRWEQATSLQTITP